jgi:hypothetical protein
MPNTLRAIVSAGDKARFTKVLRSLLLQARHRLRERAKTGLGSALDTYRLQDLEAALENGSRVLADEMIGPLWDVVGICATTTETSLTLGVLQDVVEYIALATEVPPRSAFDQQIAQKLAPQLSGPAEVVRKLLQYVETLVSGESPMRAAQRALGELLDSEDPSSGLVFYRY